MFLHDDGGVNTDRCGSRIAVPLVTSHRVIFQYCWFHVSLSEADATKRSLIGQRGISAFQNTESSRWILLSTSQKNEYKEKICYFAALVNFLRNNTNNLFFDCIRAPYQTRFLAHNKNNMNACLISLISLDVLLWHTPCSLKTQSAVNAFGRLAASMTGGTWETRLECQWAATAGHTTWSHHSHMIHTHTHMAILASSWLLVSCWPNHCGGNHDLHFSACASIQSLSFCMDVYKFRCGVRLIDPLPVQTGNAFLWRVFQSLRAALWCQVFVCGGETTDEVSFNNCLWNAVHFPPYGLGPTSLLVQGAICIAVTHILD